MEEKQNRKFRTVDLAYMGLSVALITVCSWISVPLTVPITLQTLGICLVSGLFGTKRATISVLAYVLLGIIGVPVFSGFKGGLGVINGPTGGYIVGFVFTALAVGFACDKYRGKLWTTVVSMIVGVLLCYAFGTAWFALVYTKGQASASFASILSMCVLPFLPFDAVKIAVAALLVSKLKKHIK